MFACPHNRLHRAAVAIAGALGVITLFAGGRVLFGFGAVGYAVVRPVLVFNTLMGVAYLVAAGLAVRNVVAARWLALAIVALNGMVLALLVARRASGGEVATETLGAMAFRTIAWIAIAALLALAIRPRATGKPGASPAP